MIWKGMKMHCSGWSYFDNGILVKLICGITFQQSSLLTMTKSQISRTRSEWFACASRPCLLNGKRQGKVWFPIKMNKVWDVVSSSKLTYLKSVVWQNFPYLMVRRKKDHIWKVSANQFYYCLSTSLPCRCPVWWFPFAPLLPGSAPCQSLPWGLPQRHRSSATSAQFDRHIHAIDARACHRCPQPVLNSVDVAYVRNPFPNSVELQVHVLGPRPWFEAP